MEEITFTGVPVACKSAELAAGLLCMVLETVARRRSSAGLTDRLASLQRSARAESERLANRATADIAAYKAYAEARRAKNETEIARCRRAVIEVPLDAARSALAVLDLCVKTEPVATGSIAADLSVAKLLLAAAARSILLCVKENVRSTDDLESTADYEWELAMLMERASSRQ